MKRLALSLALCLLTATANAQDEEKKEEKKADGKNQIKVEVETVVDGLDNPSGVITGNDGIYVSDSAASRVIHVHAHEGEEVETHDVITDFPQDVYGKGPKYDIGPLGLALIDEKTLVVGGGGLPDGEELLRVYELPEEGKSIKADKMKHSLGPLGPSEKTKKGEGNFYDLAVTEDAIYVTCNGDDTKGWVSKVDLKDGEPQGEFAPYIATKEATGVDAPVGIAINRKGHIVVGQMGEINVPKDSLLTFYSPKTGKMLMNLETKLHDICGLAYSPKGRLYAIDFAWLDPSQGALYRLDAAFDDEGNQGVKAVHVTDLDKPTSLTFDGEGNLYVTVFGSAEEGADKKPGKLLKITGDL